MARTNTSTVTVTKLFTGGMLEGLTYEEQMSPELARSFPTGKVVRKPVAGLPYRIVANALTDPR